MADRRRRQRGWWADSIQAQILCYNPSDLAEVAQGRKKSYEPQPYAVFNANPFNPGTTIRFGVKEPCRVVLTVCDLAGRDVCTLVEERRDAGEYAVPFDAKRLAAGICFYRIRMGNFRSIGKMVVVE